MPMDKQENKQIECYFISVESRKGGVGKTTAALTLARMLLVQSNHYEVIYFDFDIAGSEIALSEGALAGLSIWQKYVCMVENPFKDTDKKSEKTPEQNSEKKSEKINLVTLFEHYMVGENVPEIEWKDEAESETENEGEKGNKGGNGKKRNIFLTPGKINIFSSKLNRDCERENHSYGPAILFDEMHTAWFLAMTKEIVKKIRDSLEDKGKKLVVLIDNAPGYSGLEPAVEEWLTDIGPKYGKFLFVCTLDTQDFIGCSQAIRSIHDAFCGKWKISRYLFPEKKRSTENKSTENKIIFSNKGEKRFFYRLIESIPGKEICGKCSELTPMKTVPPQTCPNDDFCFYRQKENVNVGNGCEKYPAKYMGLLVNKVPILVFNSVYPFDIEVILKENGFEEKKQEAVINFLKQKHWIPYRGEWSYQFMDTDPASKQEKKAGFSHQKLLANLKNSKNTFDRDWQILEKAKAQYSGEFFLKKLVKLQFEYNHVFKDFLNSLNPSQMSDLKSFWSDDFLIISSKKKFFEAIFELFKPSGPIENSSILTQAVIGDISDNIEKSRLSMEAETIAEACWIFKEEIKERIFAFAEHKILPTAAALKKELKTVEMLSVDMAFLKNLNFRKEKIRALIRVLYAMQCIYISNLSDMERLDIEKKLEEVQFWKGLVSTSDRILALAEETLAKVGIHEEIELLAIKDEPKLLATLFKVFIETAMRVMDLNQDFKFLFECIRLILSQQQLATLVNVKLNKLAGAVIVEKTISHKEGRNILFSLGLPDDEISGVPEVEMKEVDPVKFLQTLTKLHDFEDELKKIIGNDQWNMLV